MIRVKVVKVNFTEALLKRLDADEAVKRLGRSEVIRRLADSWLRWRREREIERAYARGYGSRFVPMENELAGWGEELIWPDE